MVCNSLNPPEVYSQYSASFIWWMLCYLCMSCTVACITFLLLLVILFMQQYNFFPFLLQTLPGSRSVVLRKPGEFWGLDVGTRASPALSSTKTPAAGRTMLNFCLTKRNFDLFLHFCLTHTWVSLWSYIYHPHSHSIFSIRVLHVRPEAAMHISE